MTIALKRLLLLPLLAIVYFWLADNAVPDASFDVPYSQFSLQASALQAGKLVIDGGIASQSAYSVAAIEQALGVVTVNSSDVDFIPLTQRFYRLQNALNPGDTLLIAPAWHNYLQQEVDQTYVEHAMLGQYRYYYQVQSLAQRIRFIFSNLPLSQYWQLLHMNSAEQSVNINRYATRMAGKLYSNEAVITDQQSATTITQAYCPDPDDINNERLQRLLGLARKLADAKEVSIIFSSPPQASGHQLCSPEQRLQLHEKLKSILSNYQFPYLAHSLLPAKCATPQPYQLASTCTALASQQLLDKLRPLITTQKVEQAASVRKRLQLQRLKQLQIGHRAQALPIGEKIEGQNLGQYLAFIRGWHQEEDWGRWSKDKESIITIPLRERPGKLFIEGRYFRGNEATEIWINQQYFGAIDIQSKILDLSTVLLNEQLLEIRLRHGTPQLSNPKDPRSRRIKYGLMRLQLLQ